MSALFSASPTLQKSTCKKTQDSHDGITDLGVREELFPYEANLTNIAPWSMGSLLFPRVWQAYPASLKLACAGAGSSLLMCCYGDLTKVASKTRKGRLIISVTR